MKPFISLQSYRVFLPETVALPPLAALILCLQEQHALTYQLKSCFV